MICNKCGGQSPDDSLFCQYCGVDLTAENNQDDVGESSSVANTISMSDSNHETEPTSTNEKFYCKQCGNLVNQQTRKCENCGKQYFKLPMKTVIISFLTIIILTMFIIGYYDLNQQLIEQTEKAVKFEELYTKVGKQNIQANSEIFLWENKYNSIYPEYSFYHDYAVIVSRGVTNYHSYGCSRIDYSSIWIYNTEAAKGKGYDPCPDCQK